MTKINISSILAGEFGESIAEDKAASARAYDAFVGTFTDWSTVAPRHVNMLSRYVFSSLHEDDQRRWISALLDPANIARMSLIGTGGARAASWDRARFILVQIPADKQSLVPADRLADLKNAAVVPGQPESLQSRARRTGAQ